MLIAHPVIDAISQAVEQARSGCLQLGRGQRSVRVLLRQGKVEAFQSPLREHRLGGLAVQQSLLTSKQLGRLLRQAARRRATLGQAAVQSEALHLHELRRLIRLQALHLLEYAMDHDLRAQPFDSSTRPPGLECGFPFQWLLLDLARQCSDYFQPQSGFVASLKNGNCRVEADWNWTPQEVAVLSSLNRPRSSQWLQERLSRQADILPALGTLLILGLIEVSPDDAQGAVAANGHPAGLRLEEVVPSEVPDFSAKLAVHEHSDAFTCEQFKSLKVRLRKSRPQAPPQVIGVSSPFVEDGKSLISSNLSLSFAQDESHRVALIDCDLRRPSLHEYLGISIGPGLADYLDGSTLQPQCYLRRVDQLYVMTAGRTVANPVELLSKERMGQLVKYLRGEFDTVILDCTPCEPVSDPQVLSELIDGFLLVVRSGKTPFSSAARTLRFLDEDRILGVVLNDVRPVLFNTYYDYRHYQYGSNSGYPPYS